MRIVCAMPDHIGACSARSRARSAPAGKRAACPGDAAVNNISSPAATPRDSRCSIEYDEESAARGAARARRDRPPHPGRAAGGRAHDQCRARRAAPASRRRPACAGCAGWRRPGSSAATTPTPIRRSLGWEITFFAIVGLDSQKEAVLAALRADGRRLARGARVPHDPRRRRFPAAAGGARHRA